MSTSRSAFLLVATAAVAAGQPVSISVPPGIDSLHAAFEQRRRLGPLAGPLTITLEPGTHRLSRPVELERLHGGDGAHGVTVVGKNATVSGGIVVTTWTKHSKLAVLGGGETVWEARIPAGVDVADIGTRLQLWRGNSRLTCARSPVLRYNHANSTAFIYKDGDIKPAYHDQSNVLLVLYESWTASFNKFGTILPASRTVELQTPWPAQWANTASGSRYFIQNAREELDELGEFYFDAVAGKLLLVTAATDDPNTGDPVTMAHMLELITMAGRTASDPLTQLDWVGITFAHTSVEGTLILDGDSQQSGANLAAAMVHLTNASQIRFESCSFRASGGYGFWADHGTHHVSFVNNLATDLGAGAVRLGRGSSAVQPGECEAHTITDNVLQHGGFIWQEGCGVLAQMIGNSTISHNEIGWFRYTGVSVGWTWGYGPTVVHDIITSYNHIHDIGMGYLSDMGCVYTLGHQPGSKIQNNYCSDVQSWNYGGWGYYADEGSRDEVFENNIATRTKCGGVHQHYGTDNSFRNNILYDVDIGDVVTPGRKEILMPGSCDAAVRASTHRRDVDNCHPNTEPTHTNATSNCCCAPGCDQGKCASFNFSNNIVLLPKTSNSSFLVASWLEHGFDNFTFDKNVYFSESKTGVAGDPVFNKTALSTWQQYGKDVDSVDTDPEFASLVDFTLKSGSPALKLGFVPIDISGIGPRNAVAGAPYDTGEVTGLTVEPIVTMQSPLLRGTPTPE